MNKKARGFTLIEVMIAVAIVGILAAIALPSFQAHLRKGRRADTQAFMMDLATRQQTPVQKGALTTTVVAQEDGFFLEHDRAVPLPHVLAGWPEMA